MIEITSVNNEIVKEAVKLQQKKYRAESGKFLLEGFKSIHEAVKFGIQLDKVFVLKEKSAEYSFINTGIILTNNAVLKKIATTETPPEAVAVGIRPDNNVERLKNSKQVILLENISDAGNLGTIIRTAAAFGIGSIILYGETVDLYNPKCVRSTVGNLWKVNIVNLKTISELEYYFSDYERIATLPETENSVLLNNWYPSEKILVMFGSEADGLSDELKNYANKNLSIKMSKDVESLNLSVSAGIIMHKMNNR
ncbi:MAG: RNA methyltransferase [Candidatus Gastranaerophilales bacterium]|nr:RNA methyltransferase [Candidatus Gastranaerophilales bacterium]